MKGFTVSQFYNACSVKSFLNDKGRMRNTNVEMY